MSEQYMSDNKSISLKRLVRLGIAILLILVFLGLLLILNLYFAGYGGHWETTDFMEIYLGGRALIEGIDFYNPVAWQGVHNKYAEFYLSNPIFIYPLPAAFLFAPFAFFSIKWGATLWLLVSEILMIILIGFMLRQSELRKSVLGLLSLALIIGAFLPTIIVIGSGQYSIMMLNLIMALYLFLEADSDWAAGLCFAFLFIRPNPLLLVFPVLLVWAIFYRRYKFIWCSLLSGFGLLGLSLWINPGWISSWLNYTIGKNGKINTYGLTSQTLRGAMIDLGSGLSHSAQLGLILGISLLTMLTAALVVIRKKEYQLFTLYALAVTVSLCISPYAWNYDQMILLFSMIFILTRSKNGSPIQWLLSWMGVIFTYLLLPYVVRYIEIAQYKFSLTVIVPFVVLALQLWVIHTIPSTHNELQTLDIGIDIPA